MGICRELHYGITVWFGKLTVQAQCKLGRPVKIAIKIAEKREYQALESLYGQSVLREAHTVFTLWKTV